MKIDDDNDERPLLDLESSAMDEKGQYVERQGKESQSNGYEVSSTDMNSTVIKTVAKSISSILQSVQASSMTDWIQM